MFSYAYKGFLSFANGFEWGNGTGYDYHIQLFFGLVFDVLRDLLLALVHVDVNVHGECTARTSSLRPSCFSSRT